MKLGEAPGSETFTPLKLDFLMRLTFGLPSNPPRLMPVRSAWLRARSPLLSYPAHFFRAGYCISLSCENFVCTTNELAAFFPGRPRACARKVRYDRIMGDAVSTRGERGRIGSKAEAACRKRNGLVRGIPQKSGTLEGLESKKRKPEWVVVRLRPPGEGEEELEVHSGESVAGFSLTDVCSGVLAFGGFFAHPPALVLFHATCS